MICAVVVKIQKSVYTHTHTHTPSLSSHLIYLQTSRKTIFNRSCSGMKPGKAGKVKLRRESCEFNNAENQKRDNETMTDLSWQREFKGIQGNLREENGEMLRAEQTIRGVEQWPARCFSLTYRRIEPSSCVCTPLKTALLVGGPFLVLPLPSPCLLPCLH